MAVPDAPGRALPIVDVQRGFIVAETEHLVARLIAHARRDADRYALVLATRFVNRPGSMYETERDWHEMMGGEATELLP